MATPCTLCGGYHFTPRQSKNCELRTRIQSSPKAPKPAAESPAFPESELIKAYRRWLASLDK